jgi:hypothetical protein
MPAMPKRIPEHTMAPNRSRAPQGDNPASARDSLRQALSIMSTFWDTKFAHKEWCKNSEKTDCQCGLNGMRRYLGETK